MIPQDVIRTALIRSGEIREAFQGLLLFEEVDKSLPVDVDVDLGRATCDTRV